MIKNTLVKLVAALMFVFPFAVVPALALADTVNVNFENPPYTVGNINSQDGWMKTGAFDGAVVTNTYGFGTFGLQSLRTSDVVTSGSFGDQMFAKPLTDSVGETSATAGAYSVGTKQSHFEVQFDFASTKLVEQPGMHVSMSPDRGDGSRMSYLRFDDMPDGVHVFFDDVTDPGPLGTGATFNEYDVATISRAVPHTIKLVMDTVDGPANDVVKVYVDGVLVKTGTSWEDYYRYDPESVGEQSPRIVKTVIFRESGSANVNDAGNGFLVDNLSLMSGPAQCSPSASQTIFSDSDTQVAGHDAAVLTFVHSAWDASIPGATWIWATNPVADPSIETAETFTHDFTVVGAPTGATLMIASDNSYVVKVNGVEVGADSDGNNFQLATQDTISIPAGALVTGTNTIAIIVTNFAGGTDPQGNPAGLLFKLSVTNNECDVPPPPPTSAVVHIFKYLDGAQATAVSANNAVFPMYTATYSAGYPLGPTGYGPGDQPYEASTSPIPVGQSYTTNEVIDNQTVGASCDAGTPFAFVGYKTGTTQALAEAAATTQTAPNFTNLQSDQYVLVINHPCPPVPMLKVHILKYLDGAQATAESASNFQFPMTATWNSANIGPGSGSYTLGVNFGGAADLYGADTASMASPADYTTSEVTSADSQVVPSIESCAAGKYYLVGYGASETSFADAAGQTPTLEAPVYTDITSDRYIVVFNKKCPTTGSLTVNKVSIGGNSTFNFTGDNGIGSFQITTATNAGSMVFATLTPGTYHITELPKSGWTQTDSDCATVVVTAGGDVQCTVTNTNNKQLGAIIGTKYEDRDGDGKLKDGDHHRLSGWTIYIDTNNNGALDSGEPSTVTDSKGNYRFVGLVAGTYKVREVQKPGWTQTYPASGYYTITLAAGKVSKKNNFGNFKLGTITGMKYNDINGNGHKNAGDVGLAGWTIQLKKGNTIVATTITDANGNYTFTNLGPGLYKLSEVMQPTWRQTDSPSWVYVHSGTNSTHDDFGNTQKPKPTRGHDDDNHH